jgi:alanine racemase
MNRFRPTFAEVNLTALACNTIGIFRSLNRPEFFCPMVKANAYGHGDLVVSRKLRSIGVKHLGVGLIEEGIHLRENGDNESVLHFGMFDRQGLCEMLERHLTPVVSSLEALQILIEEAEKRSAPPVEIHLKINTGMNRLGLDPGVVAKAAMLIRNSKALKLSGVATHFANGELLSDPASTAAEQLRVFESSVAEILKSGLSGFVKHIANSDAASEIMVIAGLKGYGARPGISVYGIQSSANFFSIEPVLKLRSANRASARRTSGSSSQLRRKMDRKSRYSNRQ